MSRVTSAEISGRPAAPGMGPSAARSAARGAAAGRPAMRHGLPDRVPVPSTLVTMVGSDIRRSFQIRTYGVPDEYARFRAAGRAARAGRLRAGRRRCRSRCRGLQHLRGAGERRQPALRQPRSPAAGQERAPGHADRRGRLPGAEGPGRHHRARSLGGCRVRHAQHRLAAGAAGSGRESWNRRRWRSSSRWKRFPSVLPASRDSAYCGWVAISVGCNNTCTFCIVPSLRGREEDRLPGDAPAEVRALVADGVVEVTLLGQNVNSYGAGFGDRLAFGKLLRACGEIDGLERVRFMSPHPRDFTGDVIDAMAQTPNVMPQLHMPLQSGSDTVLAGHAAGLPPGQVPGDSGKSAGRHAGRGDYDGHHRGVSGGDGTGFRLHARYGPAGSLRRCITFQYSIRPGTPAAAMDGQAPPEVVRERYERLTALVAEITLAENLQLLGSEVEILVAEGEGRKDQATHRMSGWARTTCWCISRQGDRAAARGHGHHGRDPQRAELPDRGRAARSRCGRPAAATRGNRGGPPRLAPARMAVQVPMAGRRGAARHAGPAPAWPGGAGRSRRLPAPAAADPGGRLAPPGGPAAQRLAQSPGTVRNPRRPGRPAAVSHSRTTTQSCGGSGLPAARRSRAWPGRSRT